MKRCTDKGITYKNTKDGFLHFETSTNINVLVDKYYWVFLEIFCDDQYTESEKYLPNPCNVIDLGANRGYSTLLFANNKNVQNVFAFEPDPITYAIMEKNVALNPTLSNKIQTFSYGLSSKSGFMSFYTHPTDDGIATMKEEFVNSYWKNRKNDLITKQVEMKQASTTLLPLLSPTISSILKIDVEGAEYEILKELKGANLLHHFTAIIGECHLGFNDIINICSPTFKPAHVKKLPRDGLFSFILIKS